MKRLLLIGLTTIIGIGSLSTVASADPDWSRNRESYSYRRHHHQQPTSKLSPIPEPLRYRVERVPEPIAPETQYNGRRQSFDPYEYNEYRRERRRIKFRRYQHGTRNDPGRY
jgi:hypothetical protein